MNKRSEFNDTLAGRPYSFKTQIRYEVLSRLGASPGFFVSSRRETGASAQTAQQCTSFLSE